MSARNWTRRRSTSLQASVGCLERLRALADLRLEGRAGGEELVLLLLDPTRHVVEAHRQQAELVLAAVADSMPEIAAADGDRALRQLRDRLGQRSVEQVPGDHAGGDRQQRRGRQQHRQPTRHLGRFPIRLLDLLGLVLDRGGDQILELGVEPILDLAPKQQDRLVLTPRVAEREQPVRGSVDVVVEGAHAVQPLQLALLARVLLGRRQQKDDLFMGQAAPASSKLASSAAWALSKSARSGAPIRSTSAICSE